MFLMVNFGYGVNWEGIADSDYLELREMIPSLPAEKPKYCPHGDHLITRECLPLLAKVKAEFRVSESKDSQGIGNMLVKLQDRIAALELKESESADLALSGAAVQIHVPDFCLMQIKEVVNLDDCCTDNLQGYLDDGWRILAVCPPNAQRRPDYILGRSKE